MAITVLLSGDDISLIRAGLVLEQRSNDDVLEMLRSSDASDPRVGPLVTHHEARGFALQELLKKIT